jgi:2-polyprenyl-6-methoxyphenol hydroxylase-like FAD-dependent oxidoreductase
MPPDLGRGACEALVDAVTLATSVDRAATLSDGLRDYSALRRRRVQRLAGMTHAAARLSRMRRPLWLRDTMLRTSLLVPPPA